MSNVYRVTVSGGVSWQRVTRGELRREQVGQAVKDLLDQVGYDLPTVQIERIERRMLSIGAIDERPAQPAILVLSPWGTYPNMQINKITAIKALRTVDPARLDLKAAKDLVEGGGEIFRPWDLTSRVADYIRSGLQEQQLYTEVCAREDDPHLAQSDYSPAFDAESDPERRYD
jgi:hypothetical protein